MKILKLMVSVCIFAVLGNAQALQAHTVVVLSLPGGTVVHDTAISIGGQNWSGDWYLPREPATGLVYLQHGFTRGAGNYRDLGVSLMNNGLMVLSLNAPMTGGNPDLARSVAEALKENPPSPPGGSPFPSAWVLSGHSAGALHVTLIGQHLVTLGAHDPLKGLVLLDPVSSGNRFADAAWEIADKSIPVLALTANPSSCNAFNNTREALEGLPGDFVGIQLTNRSTHIDAEGRNTDLLAMLVCGFPRRDNVEWVRQFAGAWAGDMLSGSLTPDFYPGGVFLDTLVARDKARPIKGSGGAWITLVEEPVQGGFLAGRRFSFDVPDAVTGIVEISVSGSGRNTLFVRRDGDASFREFDCRDFSRDGKSECLTSGSGSYSVLVRGGVGGFAGTFRARYFQY